MRILHLLSQRPDATGSGIYLQALTNQAEHHGHENHIVAAANRGWQMMESQLPREQYSIIQFHTAELPFSIPGMSDVMPYDTSKFKDLCEVQLKQYERTFKNTIANVIGSFRPDIIHSHHLWLMTALVSRNFRDIPLVASSHGSDIRQFLKNSHLRHRVLDGCQHIDRVLALSAAHQAEIARVFQLSKKRIAVVGSGFNDKVFSWSKKRKATETQLIYCGKLSRAKGVPYLLRSLETLTHYQWKLHLVGGGTDPERQECLRLARQLGNRVIYHGVLQQPDLAKLLRLCHFFLLPSLFEGLPLVLLEALACGCRLIATDLPGCREIQQKLHKDVLHLVNIPELADVDRLTKTGEKNFIRGIRDTLRRTVFQSPELPPLSPEKLAESLEEFTWNRVFGRVEQIYKEVVEQNNSS